jgi:hypothetical protein
MPDYATFAADLAASLLTREPGLAAHPDVPARVLAPRPDGGAASLDLTPCAGRAQPATAREHFEAVTDVDGLLRAWERLRAEHVFEPDLPQAAGHVDGYAGTFLGRLFDRARREVGAAEAGAIAGWLASLDAYCAARSLESLLNSPGDRALLFVGPKRGWTVHFDHLAIRCGSEARGDGARIARMAEDRHGYGPSQVAGEACYRFDDGWDALPVYKMLENGQMLRLFIDESSAGEPHQIIQHWNRVYGYTAHHLALRATRIAADGSREAVPLSEVIAAVNAAGVETLKPTGEYTRGLLEQVFTRPARDGGIPERIRSALRAIDPGLDARIENAKLIELVSRREMGRESAREFFALYGLEHDAAEPLHSAPLYQYFLPAQAAHVIRTSVARGTAAAG